MSASGLRRTPGWVWAAIAVFVGSLVLTIGAVTYDTVTSTQAYSVGDALEDATFLLLGASFVVTGALIASRRPKHAVGRLLLLAGVTFGLGWVVGFASVYLFESGWEEAAGVVEGAGAGLTTLWIALVPAALLLFPTGELLSSRWRLAIVELWAVGILGVAASLVNGGWGGDISNAEYVNPLREPVAPLGDILSNLFFLTMLFGLVVSAASMIVRFRRSRGEERQQMKWLTWAAFALLFIGLPFVVLVSEGPALEGAFEVVIGVGFFMLIPAAIAIAILRYRLYDIDLVINRTLVYGSVVAILAVFYVAGVFVLQAVLPGESDLAVAATTLAAIALFNPLRHRVQRFVDRRFYRSRYDAEQVVEEFSARLRDEVDLDVLTSEWLAVIHQTVKPTAAEVWLRR